MTNGDTYQLIDLDVERQLGDNSAAAILGTADSEAGALALLDELYLPSDFVPIAETWEDVLAVCRQHADGVPGVVEGYAIRRKTETEAAAAEHASDEDRPSSETRTLIYCYRHEIDDEPYEALVPVGPGVILGYYSDPPNETYRWWFATREEALAFLRNQQRASDAAEKLTSGDIADITPYGSSGSLRYWLEAVPQREVAAS